MTTVSDNPVSDPQISCSVDAIAFNDQRLSVGEVLRSLHRHGYLRPLLQKAGEDRVLVTPLTVTRLSTFCVP